MKSHETETFSRPDILDLTGTETSTETRKVLVPRVSAPRPPISVLNQCCDAVSKLFEYFDFLNFSKISSTSLHPTEGPVGVAGLKGATVRE